MENKFPCLCGVQSTASAVARRSYTVREFKKKYLVVLWHLHISYHTIYLRSIL